MIGLDTNVLVRYLVQDDPAQTRHANALIDRAAAQETAMFINHVVMCELAWVLSPTSTVRGAELWNINGLGFAVATTFWSSRAGVAAPEV